MVNHTDCILLYSLGAKRMCSVLFVAFYTMVEYKISARRGCVRGVVLHCQWLANEGERQHWGDPSPSLNA